MEREGDGAAAEVLQKPSCHRPSGRKAAANCSSRCSSAAEGEAAGGGSWLGAQSTGLGGSPSGPPHAAEAFRCLGPGSSHLDDGVADASCLPAEHAVFEGLVHYNIGHFLQVHVAGVCGEEKHCQDAAAAVPAAFGVPGKQPRSERALVPPRSVVPNLRLAPTSNIAAPLTRQLRGDPTPSGAARRGAVRGPPGLETQPGPWESDGAKQTTREAAS